jgi:hypothetical protein
MAKQYDLDCMKFRKSTHLAGVDVDTIVAEKGQCILTIKEAYYDTNVDRWLFHRILRRDKANDG